MSATIPLIRVQLHFLFWPLLASGLCLMVYMLTPVNYMPGMGYMLEIALSMIVWLSAPLVFGGEYMEGARDYMATRPYSQERLFWMKIAILSLFAAACTVLVTLCVNGTLMTLIRFLGIALCLTYSCSAMTLLTRDLVRGILLGPVVCGVIMLILYQLWSSITVINYTLLPSGKTEAFPVIYILSRLELLTWPALASSGITLALACVIEQTRRFGKLKIPVLAYLLLLPIVLALTYLYFICYNEGHTQTYSRINYPIMVSMSGKWMSDGRLFYVNYEPTGQNNGVYSLNVLDATDYEKGPRTIGRFGSDVVEEYFATTHAAYNNRKMPPYNSLVTRDRVIMTGYENKAFVYAYDVNSGVTLLKSIEMEQSVKKISYVSESQRLRLLTGPTQLERKRVGTDLKDTVKEIDLQSGSINDVTEDTLNNEFNEYEVRTGNRCYRFIPWRAGNQSQIDVYELIDSKITGASITLDFLASGVDGNILAGYSGPKCDQIQLIDTTDLKVPRRITIDIPMRIRLQMKVELLSMIGISSDHYQNHVTNNSSISIGGGYLFFWVPNERRAAVWDIHDINQIRFVGTSFVPDAFPRNDTGILLYNNYRSNLTTPLVRPDGALGLLFLFHGPVWLEFSALMKEAKS